MNSSNEHAAFKNIHSRPYAKVAQGVKVDRLDTETPNDGRHESSPVDSTQLDLGRLGVSIIKSDASGSRLSPNYVNPHEAENRADIVAHIEELCGAYTQAARLALPSPDENKRGILGGIKEPFKSTPPSCFTIVLNGKYKQKQTTFYYEATKTYNQLRTGHTKIDDEPISTDVYFVDEKITIVDCSVFVNFIGSKEGDFPSELKPVVKLKNDLAWNGVFKIRFFLEKEQLGAVIASRDFQRDSILEELVYNPSTNTFDFKDNATLESLTPNDFVELVGASLAFTPVESI